MHGRKEIEAQNSINTTLSLMQLYATYATMQLYCNNATYATMQLYATYATLCNYMTISYATI